MNWWLKEQAVSRLWLRVLFLKVMGWLGGKGLRVPFSYLMREKNCVMLCLWEQDSVLWIQVCLLLLFAPEGEG